MNKYGYYKTKTHQDGRCIAWASTQRLTSKSPITETVGPVHFEYGKTEEDAADKVCAEVDAAYGPRSWLKL